MSNPTKSPKKSPNQNNADNPQSFDNQIATPMVRLFGVLYDGMLLLALLFLVSVVLVAIGTMSVGVVGTDAKDAKILPIWYQNLVLSPSFVLSIYWFYGIFWKKSGQTLGMQTWRLKTITSDGRLLSWGQSLVRILSACVVPAVCALLGLMIYKSHYGTAFSGIFGFVLNYLFCYVHPKGLAVHDLLSNTVTVRIAKYEHKGIFFGRK